MSIIINNEIGQTFKKDYEIMISEVIEASLNQEGCPYETEVSVTITDNEGIQEINQEFRNIDEPTDVLSFPMIQFEEPSNFDEVDEESDEYFDLDTGELMIGDIMISMNKAIEQAEQFGHSLEREIGFLTAHSMLHLMGYDHIILEEESIMKEKQEQILNKVGLER